MKTHISSIPLKSRNNTLKMAFGIERRRNEFRFRILALRDELKQLEMMSYIILRKKGCRKIIQRQQTRIVYVIYISRVLVSVCFFNGAIKFLNGLRTILTCYCCIYSFFCCVFIYLLHSNKRPAGDCCITHFVSSQFRATHDSNTDSGKYNFALRVIFFFSY